MRKIKIILILVTFSILAKAQGLRNEGNLNIGGGYLVIQGNYQNENSGSITLDGTISLTGNWTNNGTGNVIQNPGTNGEVVFNGTGTQTIGGTASVFNFEKLTINAGSVTEVQATKGVSAYGACTFTSPLVLKASTSINAFHPQMATFINYGTVIGNITMELPYTSTGSSASGAGRGMFFSSPVNNATASLFNVQSGANLLWYHDEVLRQYVKVTRNTDGLNIAKGYLLRSATSNTFSITGQPNINANYSKNNIPRMDNGHYYLVGNPYPSTIRWEDVQKTNLSNSIWIRTSTGTGTMVVDTWNGNTDIGTNNNGFGNLNGYIAPMQSFFVQCDADGLVGGFNISNSNRVHNLPGNGTFLKSARVNDKSILRLRLSNGGTSDETIIVESSLAQDSFDDWDSKKMFQKDGKRAEIYSLSPDKINKNLVIQSVKPIITDKSIRLGIYTGLAGTYKFTADLSGSTRSGNIFLEDTKLKNMQDLFANPEYTFTSEAVEDTSRFILHFLKAPLVKAKSSLTACSPAAIDLTEASVIEGSDAELTFTYWTDKDATIPCNTPASATTGTYYIKGTAPNGLSTTAGPVQVTINPAPLVVINLPAEVNTLATINLTAPEITGGSTPGLKFSYWKDRNTTIPYSTPQFATPGQYYIKGTVESTGCYSVEGFVHVNSAAIATGTEPGKDEESSVYASGNRVHVVNGEVNSAVYIFDILGRQQYQGILSSDHDIIDTGLKTGNYIIKIVTCGRISSKKIFISNGNN